MDKAKIEKFIADNLAQAILGAIISGAGGSIVVVAKFLYDYFTTDNTTKMSNFMAVALSFGFSFSLMLIVSGLIGWVLLILLKAKQRIDKLEKAVSADYKNKSWSDDERETNVLFIIRENDLKATNESFSDELKTANEKLEKLDQRVTNLEPQKPTVEGITGSFLN